MSTVGAAVIGIDPSLNGTGLSVIYEDGEWHTSRVEPQKADPKRYASGQARIGYNADRVMNWVWAAYGASRFHRRNVVAVMEGPSYASKSSSAHQLAQNWGVIRHSLWMHGVPVAVVPPSTLKVFTTGMGNAGKFEVMAAVKNAFPGAALATNDEADALGLAWIGANRLAAAVPNPFLASDGRPTAYTWKSSKKIRDALEKIDWQEWDAS